jgi:hypothetical protein
MVAVAEGMRAGPGGGGGGGACQLVSATSQMVGEAWFRLPTGLQYRRSTVNASKVGERFLYLQYIILLKILVIFTVNAL